jgi:hypothetical protein
MPSFAPRRAVLTRPISASPQAPDPNGLLAADLEAMAVADTKIMQKVNHVHREAFAEKYPGQVEHCLRLTMERLQSGLDKRGTVELHRPDTWILTPVEIKALSEAAYLLDQIRRGF